MAVALSNGSDVLDLGKEIVRVHIVAIMLLEIELVAGPEGTANTRSADDQMLGLLFLHSDVRQGSALGLGLIIARIVKHFVLGIFADLHNGRVAGNEICRGGLKIVISQGTLAGSQL